MRGTIGRIFCGPGPQHTHHVNHGAARREEARRRGKPKTRPSTQPGTGVKKSCVESEWCAFRAGKKIGELQGSPAVVPIIKSSLNRDLAAAQRTPAHTSQTHVAAPLQRTTSKASVFLCA